MRQEQNALVLYQAREIFRAARGAELGVWALGGLGVFLECPDYRSILDDLRSPLADVDLFTLRRDVEGLAELLVSELGFAENLGWKMLSSHHRRVFYSGANLTVELFIDELQFCQNLDLRQRVPTDSLSLTVTDLFLSRVQRVPLTPKDLVDLRVLLAAHGPAAGSQRFETERVASLASKSWRWWRTLRENLPRLRGEIPQGPDRFRTLDQSLDLLWAAIEAAPKGLAWKLRSIVGDRLPWYREVE